MFADDEPGLWLVAVLVVVVVVEVEAKRETPATISPGFGPIDS